ncbi:MAG: PD-(D/E)XK nuclease family protein [Acidobacteriota bacterium]
MKLLTGSANSGKTRNLLSRIAQCVSDKQQSALLIIPSSAAADIFHEALQTVISENLPDKAKPLVITFPNLFQKVLGLCKEQRDYLTSLERDRVLRNVVAGLAEQNALSYFHNIAHKSGLIDSLATFIDELWRSNTDAKRFTQLIGLTSKKAQDVALIFGEYEKALEQMPAVDAEGAGVRAVKALEKLLTNPSANLSLIEKIKSEFPLVACDGFDFYTPTQIRLLELLGHCGVETVASLTYEADRAVHLWHKPTWERFVDMGAEVVHFDSPSETSISQAATRLMREQIADLPGESFDETGQASQPINIISAPDRGVEVRAVAREIKRLTIEDNFALEDITIVCRSLATYAHHCERIFAECGIRVMLDCQLALAENPCVIAVIKLLQLEINHFRRRLVIDALRSPYFDFSAFELTGERVDVLDDLSLKAGVMQGHNQWIEAIEKPAKKTGEDENADIVEFDKLPEPALRSSLANQVKAFFQALSFPENEQRKNYAQRIKNLLTKLQVAERIQLGKSAVVDALALQRLLALLDFFASERAQGDALESAKILSRELFFADFFRAINQISFARPDNRHPAILVQEAHNLRPRTYRAIFIVGLNEGEFPKKSAETAPYTRLEKANLRRAGIDFTETTSDAGADLTQFHKAMTRATQRLFLSYARTDFAGGELLKSYLLDEVCAVAETRELRLSQIETADAKSFDEAASLEELAQRTALAMRKQLDSDKPLSPNPLIKSASTLLTGSLTSWTTTVRASQIERLRLAGLGRGIYGGIIANEKLAAKIQQQFNEDYLFSASKINDYGLCPFRFFARNVLRLAPVDEPREGFAPDRLGTAYHEILERAYRMLKEQGMALSEATFATAAEIVEQVSEAVLTEMLEKGEVRQTPLWEFEKADMKKRVVNLLRAEMHWNADNAAVPVRFEQRFGYGKQPPLVIGSLSGNIRIRGQIDRIDERDGELVVIDYKTARTPVSAREAEAGRNLQLPIYLMAADRVLLPDKAVAAGYYLHITSCKKGSELPKKNLSVKEVVEKAEDFINDYVSSIRRAEFPIAPNQNRCPPCEFETMCRIQSLGTSADED